MQDSFGAKLLDGSSVNVVGPPEELAPWAPLAAQEIVNQPAATSTGSLNVIEMFASSATPLAPAAGVVAATLGAWSAGGCGSGGPAVKSGALLSLSTVPPPLRWSDVVLVGAGAGPVPSKQLAVVPKPTKS